MEVPEKGTNFEADDYYPRRPLLKSNSQIDRESLAE